ncbi:type I-C CRISPR-associated protein Cas8c/Csd1 [Schlesneria sp. DSM 10557]|uniref:type I-C CRISPR-associated protein Cas8c/Csd1 n=1 Tax=Schlesneria sp. DSM 10557 TaxID=3044399 RepID=UPI0035A1CD7D
MILQALNSYYERLAAEPDSDIAPAGFSRQKISYAVVLDPDGSLHGIEDLRTGDGKKKVAASLLVCGDSKPPGAGVNPCFLWDNPAYMLGYKPDDPKPERTRQAFEAFRQRHLELEQTIQDPQFSAVCRFLEKWDPAQSVEHPGLVEIGTGFGLFRIRGKSQFVHEVDSVRQWWRDQLQQATTSTEAELGQCLVTGRKAPIARLHDPKIKGVSGAQSSGAAIVSFNLDAFESYGKEQSRNAPVSETAAFQYCTALNSLLADRSRRVQIGDATTVFWTEKPTPMENIFGLVLGNPPPEDEGLLNKLQNILHLIAQGKYPAELGDKETPFYILGLSPNAARISVRFWRVSSLGEIVANLQQHFVDLSLQHRESEPDFISPWQILRETVRDSKDIPPQLSGALMRSILSGQAYPQMLLAALIRRVRADRELRYLRVAPIKACLNRQFRLNSSPTQEIAMTLDPNREDVAYCLGRLFAELEKTQEDALPGINDTIKDRYFGSASATPAAVFPRLIRLSQHHLGKLEKGKRLFHEKRFQEIVGKLQKFPGHLNLQDQGLFAIGYYHQRQDFFIRKEKAEPDALSAVN